MDILIKKSNIENVAKVINRNFDDLGKRTL